MAKRGAGLANLGDRLARKPSAESAPAASSTPAADEPAKGKQAPDGRKGILVRAKPEAWRELKILAIDKGTTLQDVMTEAINDFLRKNGKPPVA